jgi:hypothetical protein
MVSKFDKIGEKQLLLKVDQEATKFMYLNKPKSSYVYNGNGPLTDRYCF